MRTRTLLNRTRLTLKVGDRFALRSNPGSLTAYWKPTFGVGERWHTVEKIQKRRQPIGGHLVYRVTCQTCGNVGTIYADARMDVIR